MEFETVQIHFLRDIFGLFSSGNFATNWQHDVITSPLSIIKCNNPDNFVVDDTASTSSYSGMDVWKGSTQR